MSRFRLSIDSNLADLFVVSMVVRGVCGHVGMDEAEASSVEVCAIEAATNAIKHAYRKAPGREVSIQITFNAERLDVDVLDQGESMPEEQLAKLRNGSPVLEFDPADLAAVPEGGMGLQIINEVMDEIAYNSEAGINRLRLVKLLPR